MMEKIIEVGSWDAFDVSPVALLKVGRDGFGPADRRDFLEKRAGDHVFVDQLSQVKLGSGDVPIHLIALGATEAYGPNRNGDGFKAATCIAQVHTFRKFARYYRYHKNKDPKKSYGKVALAAYNEPMRRIELLLIGNGTKEAAKRNEGLVMPGSTVDSLHAGKDVGFSMACKIPHDVCSICNNKAANRREYCTSDTCLDPETNFRGLGCKEGLAKLCSNGRQQYVENPNAIFFDMSEVNRPADRTAYGAVADYLQKAASADRIVSGAELAELYARENGYDGWTIDCGRENDQVDLVHKLAAIEAELAANGFSSQDTALMRGLSVADYAPLDLSVLGAPGSEMSRQGLFALAAEKVALSLRDFLQYVSGGAEGEKLAAYVSSVTPHLPGVFGRLAFDPSLPGQIAGNTLSPARGVLPSMTQRTWAKVAAAGYSLVRDRVENRIHRAALRQDPAPRPVESVKTAAADEPGEGLARQFALYKVAFLATLSESEAELPLTQRLVVLQNHV